MQRAGDNRVRLLTFLFRDRPSRFIRAPTPAVVRRLTGSIATIIESALAEDPVPGIDEIVGRLAAANQELGGPDGAARVAPSAWAEALYDPAVADIVRGLWGTMRGYWIMTAQRMRDHGRLPPETDVDAVGAALSTVLPGSRCGS
jgi:hypothetical protein